MKRCPECGREYDVTMSFCLDDGTELLYGPATEPQTAILHETAQPGEVATRAQIHSTQETGVVPSAINASTGRSFDKRLIAAPVVLAIVVVVGFSGYRYLSPANEINSIAVMPFVNESGNADVEYLSDGMTETLISSLSRLPSLNVKPRSLVFRYKGKEIDLQTVGRELGVEAILSGRVVPRGGDISLFVELIDVASTKVVWSRQYSRKQSDLVVLQSEIARDVSSTLKSGLSGEEEKKVTENGTNNPEAFRLYLLGRSLAGRRKERDARKAIENFEKAIALDPNYASAYLGLAQAYQFLAIYGNVPASETMPKSRAAILRALEISPDLAEAHVGLSSTELFMNRDHAAAERELQKALELNPNYAGAHRLNGMRLAFLGRNDEALAEFRKSIDLDPTLVTARINNAWALFYANRIDESDAELDVAQDLEPTFWFIELQRFINSRGRGDHASAVEHLARAQELRDEPEAAKFVRDSFARGGWNRMMRAAVADPERMKLWNYYLASFAAELGDKDAAFALLDKAYDKNDQFIFFAKIDPAMRPLHGDPRYNALLKKLGLE